METQPIPGGDAGQGGRVPLVVPDLTPEGPVKVSLWLVPRGATVLAGDRVVELLAGGATIDLEAPLAGRLVRQLVDEDDIVGPGTVLAEIEPAEGV
jgi:pyruvate/2-oxoglutarate dehydrogenase complex dihydrolipoamide acyltransferase (E2) component